MTEQQKAKAAGYYVREGEYQGTTDNRLGRWYVGHAAYDFYPHGAGHATQKQAWDAAIADARELGRIK